MLSLGAVELLFVSDGAHDLDASAAILPDNGKVQALLFSVVLKFLPGTEIHLQKIVINVHAGGIVPAMNGLLVYVELISEKMRIGRSSSLQSSRDSL